MKVKIFYALLLSVLTAPELWAQTPTEVEKQVEVRKTYSPRVGEATKLRIRPNMTDTTRLNPEIDYAITPLSLEMKFEVDPIMPATVTYWEFNRPRTSYLKIGAGYPLNSVADFYVSTENAATGYVVGYLNHEGHFDKIVNDYGVKNRALRMTNRGGVALGKYFGRYTLEGDLRYSGGMFDRYGAYSGDGANPIYGGIAESMAKYHATDLMIRFGDDFQDLNRTNFAIAVRGGYFFDASDWVNDGDKARQTNLDVDLQIGRKFRHNTLKFRAGYEFLRGTKIRNGLSETMISAGDATPTSHTARAGIYYGTQRRIWHIESGADVCFSKMKHKDGKWFVLPYLRATCDFGIVHFMPFVEIDGTLHSHDFRSLMEANPYIAPATWIDHRSVDYNLRVGLMGSLWHNKLSYRIYGSASSQKDRLRWYGLQEGARDDGSFFALLPELYDMTLWSFDAELLLRPLSALSFKAGFHAYHYDNNSIYGIGEPAFRGNFSVAYDHRKFMIGLSADLESERWWTMIRNGELFDDGHVRIPERDGHYAQDTNRGRPFEVPLAVDVRLILRWKLTPNVGLFAEGFNLANADLYRCPWYKLSGAGFTLGAKVQF